MKHKKRLKTYFLITILSTSTTLFAQNTISVKKKSKIEGFYSHKNKFNNYDYLYFNANGNVSYAKERNKSKKQYFLLKECTKNKDKCFGLQLYSYNINEEFADKGLSPFIHIEFYQISENDGFNFSELQGELNNEVLFIKPKNRWYEYKFIKK